MVSPILSIVIPVFNERDNLQPIITALHSTLDQSPSISWEAIFVDDNSPDKTWKTAKEIASQDKHIRVIRRIGRTGLSSAVIEGVFSSAATYIVIMDGDGQHDEKLIPVMIQKLQDGNDVVVASRFALGGSAHGLSRNTRVVLSKSANKLANLVLNVKTTDPMTGFFALKRTTFEDVAASCSGTGFKILFDILARMPRQSKLAEVPLNFRRRLAGSSKLNSKVFLQAVRQLTLLGFKRLRFLPYEEQSLRSK